MNNQQDQALKTRARQVLPNGVYGHQSTALLPDCLPQFFAKAKGAYLWDYDGNRYIDYMSAYGPNLFGYNHAAINAAYTEQLVAVDVATGPSATIVELAEAMVAQIIHADWAMFCKNGTDSTTIALMIARAGGKRKILLAQGAYHGSAPWCTPLLKGTVADDRQHFIYYAYNDAEALEQAVHEAGDDLAAIVASPFKHDFAVDQELPSIEYAKKARALCDQHKALLVVDDVRAGLRIARDCSWQDLNIQPDLSCWGKAIANGHPISAVLGAKIAKEAAEKIYVTGSFWFASAAMAAALKTLELVRTTGYLEHTVNLGNQLRAGLDDIAGRHSLPIIQTGPSQMPLIMFNDGNGKHDIKLGMEFVSGLVTKGIYFHPFHNMFINAAMTTADIDQTLQAAEATAHSLRPQQKQAH